MTSARLPLLVSIPHGGRLVPAQVSACVAADRRAVFDDGDAGAREIYDVGAAVAATVVADVARAFVDMNRARDDRPPGNPDGVVKSHTCFGVPVYRDGAGPPAEAVEALLTRFWDPYHEMLATSTKGVRLALDCHTMASTAPMIAPDPGAARPPLCVSDADGESCPAQVVELVRRALAEAFELELADVAHNEPFRGGYITRTYGMRPCPWVQIEMSRDLFLAEPWFDEATLSIAAERTSDLRGRFLSALHSISDALS